MQATCVTHIGILVLGKAHCVIGIIVAGQAAVDGLAEQRDQVVADVAAGTAFLEIVGDPSSEGEPRAQARRSCLLLFLQVRDAALGWD